jgi:hypothetical protein
MVRRDDEGAELGVGLSVQRCGEHRLCHRQLVGGVEGEGGDRTPTRDRGEAGGQEIGQNYNVT